MVRAKFEGPKGTKSAKKKKSDGVKKRSSKPSFSGVLKEIQNHQRSADHEIARAPYQRLVHEGGQNFPGNLICQNPVMAAFQEAAEAHIANLLEDSSMCALYSKRTTVLPKDVKLAQRIRGEEE